MAENNIKIEDGNENEDEEPKDRNEEDPAIMERIKANEQNKIIDEKINQGENAYNNANTNEILNSLPLQQNVQQEEQQEQQQQQQQQEQIDNYNFNSVQNTNPLNQRSKVPAKIISVKYHSAVLNNKMKSSAEATSQNNISSRKMQEYNDNNFNNYYRVNPMNDAATESYQMPTNINQQYQYQYQYGF